MTRAEALARVVGANLSSVNVREVGKDNHGEQVARFLKSCGLSEGYPWCAALQSYNGHGALLDPLTKVSAWPLPLTASCSQLAAFAEKHGVLFDTPQVGDLMLFWEFIKSENQWRYGHVGIVVALPTPTTVANVEGNTNDDGSRNGWGVLVKPNRVWAGTKHRFARWVNLLPE